LGSFGLKVLVELQFRSRALGNLPLNLSKFSHLGQIDFPKHVFRIADFADFSSFLELTLQKQFSLPEILCAFLTKSFAAKMAVFN
jgi:hypothetical protein